MSLLGLDTSGDGGMYIRWMASANAWKAGGEEVTLKYFVLDYHSVKTGWGWLQEGLAPGWSWDEKVGVKSKRPGDTEEEQQEWKRGFSVMLFEKELGVREWATTATGAIMGFDLLYSAVATEAPNHEGLLPVIEYTKSEPLKVGKGNTRVPEFVVVKWVEKPADFQEVDIEIVNEPSDTTLVEATISEDKIPF